VTQPAALVPSVEFFEKDQKESLLRLSRWVVANGIDAPGYARAARDILLRRPPRLDRSLTGPLRSTGESAIEAAQRLVSRLDSGCLPIQGPPGTGKTFAGAEMALDLVAAGKKVGVVAQSHAVIGNFLDEICRRADVRGASVRVVQRANEDEGRMTGGSNGSSRRRCLARLGQG